MLGSLEDVYIMQNCIVYEKPYLVFKWGWIYWKLLWKVELLWVMLPSMEVSSSGLTLDQQTVMVSTHPLMLLATEECLDIDFGDISNSESDLPKTSVILQLNPVSHILTVNFCILHIALWLMRENKLYLYLIKWFKIPLMQVAISVSYKLLNNSVQTTYY